MVVLDALTYAGNIENLAGLGAQSALSLRAAATSATRRAVRQLLEQHRIDTVVHFAAESHVDRSILGPDDFIRTNVVGTHSLLKAAKALWIDRKVGSGASLPSCLDRRGLRLAGPGRPAVSTNRRPTRRIRRTPPARPPRIIWCAPITRPMDSIPRSTNCSNNYGPYQFPEKLIPLTLINILQGKPLPVYGDGLQVRDWLHVADHCEAIALALERGKPGEVYNIGGNSETTNIQLVRTLCGLVDELLGAAGRNCEAAFPASPAVKRWAAQPIDRHVRDRPGHDRRYAIDFAKAQRELGYAPAHQSRRRVCARRWTGTWPIRAAGGVGACIRWLGLLQRWAQGELLSVSRVSRAGRRRVARCAWHEAVECVASEVVRARLFMRC